MAAKSERFLQESPWRWEDAASPLLGTAILPYEPLATRLDPKAVARLVEPAAPDPVTAPSAPTSPTATATATATAATAAATSATSATSAASATSGGTTPPATISIDELLRVDLRVARIIAAEPIPGADKLLQLTVDIGELGERRIFAGIRAAYAPESLVGRLTVVAANLAPRKMRFGTSEGMVLAAGPGGREVFLLAPDSGAAAGMRIK
jgi:methionyl-tRNA synthetase